MLNSSKAMATPAAASTSSSGSSSRPFRPLFSKLANSFGYASDSSPPNSDCDSDESANNSPVLGPTIPTDDKLNHIPKILPQCWGHRGASAAYPENTLASFKQAILDGADAIESDIHVSMDGTPIMFHDAYLNRTTNGKGLIKKQNWKGGIDQLRTTKLPAQPVCTFADLLDLLLEPGHEHVLLNVDVKLDNDPELLYRLMHEIIVLYPEWETRLAPRLILGLWHAKYIEPAQRLLPYCRLAHIGVSPDVARKYFWEACEAFSLNYSSLLGKEGELFRKECKDAGKDLYVWTVNSRKEMINATTWGVKAILTDKTADYLTLKGEMSRDYTTIISKELKWTHAWSNIYYYTPVNAAYMAWETFLLQRTAGVLAPSPTSVSKAKPKAASGATTVASS